MHDSVELDVQGLQILDEDTCWHLVESTEVGRLGFSSDDRPLILPVNHRVLDRSVVFRTAEGSKLTAAVLRRPVVFEVDGWSTDHRSGWSVLVHGVAMPVRGGPLLERLTELDLEPWANEAIRTEWVRIRTKEVSGRATPVKP